MTNEEKRAKKLERKKKKEANKGELKKFLFKGNIVDMSVGVIIGGAFTAIVTALTNGIFKPLINFILVSLLGEDDLTKAYTYLKVVYELDELGQPTTNIDLVKSIYIDWGSLINAIINFILIGLILFAIVKFIAFLIAKKNAIAAKAQEEHYKKHPEDRPEPEPAAVKEPTTNELLTAILTELRKGNEKPEGK